MADEVVVEAKKPAAVPELIKNPKAAFQALESGAKTRLRNLTEFGDARLTELDRVLGGVSKDEWSFSGMLRKAEALRGRAVTARASVVKRVDEMPGLVVAAMASAGRAQVQALVRRLKWLTARLEHRDAMAESQG
jgi:hypothetical protein